MSFTTFMSEVMRRAQLGDTQEAYRATVATTVDEFFRRVSEREGVELPEGTRHARVVVGVLREAAPPGHVSAIEAQLPGEYVRLFAPGAERPG